LSYISKKSSPNTAAKMLFGRRRTRRHAAPLELRSALVG